MIFFHCESNLELFSLFTIGSLNPGGLNNNLHVNNNIRQQYLHNNQIRLNIKGDKFNLITIYIKQSPNFDESRNYFQRNCHRYREKAILERSSICWLADRNLPGTSLGPLIVDNGPLPYLTWQGSALLETTAISSSSCPSPGPPRVPPPWLTSLPTELSCDCFRPRQLSTNRFAVDITPSSSPVSVCVCMYLFKNRHFGKQREIRTLTSSRQRPRNCPRGFFDDTKLAFLLFQIESNNSTRIEIKFSQFRRLFCLLKLFGYSYMKKVILRTYIGSADIDLFLYHQHMASEQNSTNPRQVRVSIVVISMQRRRKKNLKLKFVSTSFPFRNAQPEPTLKRTHDFINVCVDVCVQVRTLTSLTSGRFRLTTQTNTVSNNPRTRSPGAVSGFFNGALSAFFPSRSDSISVLVVCCWLFFLSDQSRQTPSKLL